MTGADDCWTDHRLVISRLQIHLQRKPRQAAFRNRKPFDTRKLLNPEIASAYENVVLCHLQHIPPSNSVDDQWMSLRDALITVSEEVIGPVKRHHQDWFDENSESILAILESKRQAKLAYDANPTEITLRRHKEATKACAKRIRKIKNEWWQAKSEELERYSDQRDMRSFYSATKEIYGPRMHAVSVLMSRDGHLITNTSEILRCWRNHFNDLLNNNTETGADLLKSTPQYCTRHWMDAPPSYEDFMKALTKMKPRRAAGPDRIPLELWTHGGSQLQTQLFKLMTQMWEEVQLPSDLKKNAIIVPVHKKGDRTVCGNYRGIFLLSVAGKILARILLNRLLAVAEEVLPESQCGFRASRGTIDMMFCARQLQEKCREQSKDLYLTFWDLAKAFDSVPRPAMWATLRRFGCPDRFVSLISAFHENMEAQIECAGLLTDPFPITSGVKQGCVLAPTLFSLYLAAMMKELPPDMPGIKMRTCTDGGLFNLGRFRATSLTSKLKVTELQYADDNATLAHTQEDAQRAADLYESAYKRFGLSANEGKTKVMFQSSLGSTLQTACITINNNAIEQVADFRYLGSYLSVSGSCSKDIESRIKAAHAAYGGLVKKVFRNHALTTRTKIMVFRAVVVSTLLYGCETWTLYAKDLQKLEHFQQSKLRAIFRISWRDKKTNNEVLTMANMPSVESVILKHRIRWAGHVARMSSMRLPHAILFGELIDGQRPRRKPKKRYKDQLKLSLAQAGIDCKAWQDMAQDRPTWSHMIREGVEYFESRKVAAINRKRRERKERQEIPRSPPKYCCRRCPRMFYGHLALASHMRAFHKP